MNSYANPENINIENYDPVIAYFYPTQPLTVTNNLEGGGNVNYKVKWRAANIEETKYSNNSPYYAFDFENTQDKYDITAFPTINAFNTNWYFLNWNDGTTNNIKSQVGLSSPLSLTANYKGNLTSNQTDAYSSNSQQKTVRDNIGYYHTVYSSMGNVWYTYSLTSDFNGNWSQEEWIGENAKNPAIDFYGNNFVLSVYAYTVCNSKVNT